MTLIVIVIAIYEGHVSIEIADNKQSNFANELSNFDKGIKSLEKKFFQIS